MDCNEMQLEHISQLATMQNKILHIETTVRDLTSIKDTLTELKIISKQNIEFNLTQLKSNKEVEGVLVKINENLNQLNKRVKTIEEKDIKDDTSATELRVEEQRNNAAMWKAKFTFYGVIVAAALGLIGIIIPLMIN